MIKTVFIYPNMYKDGVQDVLPVVCDILQQAKIKLLLPSQLRDTVVIGGADYFAAEHALRLCDLAITLGGDGTMLRIARTAAQNHVPLLGINLGHIGFMTELERDELDLLGRICSGEYELDERMMLHIAVQRNDKIVYENDALNDVVIAKGTAFRVVRVQISADQEPVIAFSGDGVIISTPTGTTAYSLSAGGPIIEPSAENMAVTPICAHALQAKAFVFSPDRVVSVQAYCAESGDVFVSADGTAGFAVRPEDCVKVTRSPLTSRLVRLKGGSFYRILQQKL